MKTTYRICVLLLLFFFLAGLTTVSAKDEYTKTISKQFNVKNGDKLIVDNRFGKVQCVNSDKDELSIRVNITVTAHNEEEAGKYFNRINIDINQNGPVITAKTSLSENHSASSNFSIDYEVNMPAYMDLTIDNKFGDIFINELAGKGDIEVSYGNIDINKLINSDNLVQVKFGQGRIGWMKGAVVNLSYSKLDLDYSGSMRLNSKYSDLAAGQIISLNCDFEGGNLSLTNSSVIECRSKFSQISVGKLDKSVTLNSQYGNFDVDAIAPEFTNIDVRNRFGQISLNISGDASYTLDASMQFCDLDYPNHNAHMTEVDVNPTSKTYKGTIGQADHPAATVTIDSQYGGVSIE